MRANITTAPVFPGAADGAVVVGMMVGGAGPMGGVPREEHPLALPAPAPAILASRNARHHQRRIVAAPTRLCRGKLPERGFPPPHIQFTSECQSRHNFWLYDPSIDNPQKVFHAA